MFLRKLLGDEKLKEFNEIKKIHIDDSFSKKSEAKIAMLTRSFFNIIFI